LYILVVSRGVGFDMDGKRFQPDADGDGVGDRCEDRATVGFSSVYVWESEERFCI
jgi:hypothetical protein